MIFNLEETLKLENFSNELPGFQTAWDSTSLSWLKECPRKYYYNSVLGLRGKGTSPHLIFGTLYHRGLEIYNELRFKEGMSAGDAIRKSLTKVLSEAGNHCRRYVNGLGEEKLVPTDEPELDPDSGWEYIETIWKQWESPHATKNIPSLIRSLVWYHEAYKPDPAKTVILSDGSPAVELSFRYEYPMAQKPTSEPILLCGHLDRLVNFLDKIWVMDYKTTTTTLSENYYAQFHVHNQMSFYAAASTIVLGEPAFGVMIDAAQITTHFTRFGRGLTPRTHANQNEFLTDLNYWVNIAAHCAEEEYWPQNDTACDKYGGCTFRDICAKSPDVRGKFLSSEFSVNRWNPLETR